jgi:hypothetical protein
MTLVVSEVTGFGIVMVGDSAVTVRTDDQPRIYTGAAKVQYSRDANVGFAMWGRACVGGQTQDTWLSQFIASIRTAEPLGVIAQRLADELNAELSREGRPWSELRRGIHIAGYVDRLPHLYHVHTGDPTLPQHELQVFKDFPYIHAEDLDAYRTRLETVGGYHLRNGFYELFGTLFDAVYRYTEVLRPLGFTWPNGSLDHRVSLYRLLVRFVSDTLVADGRLPSVGGEIQALAFTERGLAVDQLQRPVSGSFPCGTQAEFAPVDVAA